MQASFYIITEPTNKVNKTLGTAIKTCGATPQPTGSVDVVNPVLIIDGPLNSAANYCHISGPLNRYYFITALDYTIANKVVVSLHVDVLMTYKGFLKATTLNYVSGAEDINEVADSSYPLGDYIKTETFKIADWDNSVFTNNDGGRRYILRVAAGKVQSGTAVNITVGGYVVYGKWKYDVIGPADNATLSFNSEAPGDTTTPRLRNNSIVTVNATYKYKAVITGVEPNVAPFIDLVPLF